jgi:hypothetical protein
MPEGVQRGACVRTCALRIAPRLVLVSFTAQAPIAGHVLCRLRGAFTLSNLRPQVARRKLRCIACEAPYKPDFGAHYCGRPIPATGGQP